MPTIKHFEDLDVWKEAKDLNYQVFQIFGEHRNFGFRDQILRAALSVMNNIAEGFERDSDKEFQRFLKISKGSSGEVRSMLYVAKDLNYLDEEVFSSLLSKYFTLSSKLGKFIQYLNKK